jgi:hypothetical protein
LNREKTFWQRSHCRLHAPPEKRQIFLSSYLFNLKKGLIHIFLCYLHPDFRSDNRIIQFSNCYFRIKYLMLNSGI